MLYRSNKIFVEDSPVQGRGVFCSELIKAGEVLEECHYILCEKNYNYPQILQDHFFSWPKGGEGFAICLGYGSVFNHSDIHYNADWETDTRKNRFVFYALRDILPGEEIFTNYQK